MEIMNPSLSLAQDLAAATGSWLGERASNHEPDPFAALTLGAAKFSKREPREEV